MSNLPPGFEIEQPQTPAVSARVSGLPPGFEIEHAPEGGGPMSWSDVGSQAIGNIPASAGRFATDIAQPFLHPMQTAENIGDVGHGLAQRLGVAPEGGHEDEAKWDALADHFKGRYGSVEGFKHALATDPVGVVADLSIPFTGGEMALARAPGILGRVGEASGMVGRALDPVSVASKSIGLAGKVGAHAFGLTTGAGDTALKTAYSAGQEGGEAARAFRENLTGAAPMEDAVEDARNALGQMRKERGQAYRDAMQGLSKDKTILSWNDVDTALNDMDRVATFKGQSLSPSTESMRDAIRSTIDDWKNLRASEFWTPEGFDALKKKVGDLRDSSQYGTPERVVADQAYQAIRKTIIDQAPQYAGIMKGYESASEQLREIEKTLSLTPNATVDAALRKLQSTLRDNVNTSFGRRAELANYLVNAGAPHLMEKLAGQSLKSWAPRGLARAVAAAGLEGTAGLAAGAGAALKAVPLLATMSPRLMGEAAYAAGKASPYAKAAAITIRPARQIGRLTNPYEDQQP